MSEQKRHAELVSASMNEIPNQVRDDSDSKYSDILDYDWNYDSLPNRMPLSQRAKIFLPFAALTGFDEAIQNTIQFKIDEMGE